MLFVCRLMVLGLDQFKHLPYFHQLIRKFLLPSKSEEQIRVRIKNMTSSKASQNIIKVVIFSNKADNFSIYLYLTCNSLIKNKTTTKKTCFWLQKNSKNVFITTELQTNEKVARVSTLHWSVFCLWYDASKGSTNRETANMVQGAEDPWNSGQQWRGSGEEGHYTEVLQRQSPGGVRRQTSGTALCHLVFSCVMLCNI